MNKAILALAALCCTIQAQSQDNIKTYVKGNTVAIANIEPDSADYSDLAVIGNAIGDARVVMLGEQDHGDAPAFLAKTRLIKYLHEKKGFNVLAFESDFFALNYGWDHLDKSPNEVDSFITKNIFPIWTYCTACNHLFHHYIPSTYPTPHPLMITGFDSQIFTRASRNMAAKLDSVLRSLDLPVTKQPYYAAEIIPGVDSLIKYAFKRPTDSSWYVKYAHYLEEVKKQAGQKLPAHDFWMMVINNLVQENTEYRTMKTDYRLSYIARDYQMAQNLAWLVEHKYAGEKIIVWAANYHVSKYTDTVEHGRKILTSMGYFFTRNNELANKTYILGFTSYQGSAGRLGGKNFEVPKPKSNGFENWINKSYPYAFVDFKSYHEKFPHFSESFYMKGLTHTNLEKDWTQLFDGIFYIKDMYPCRN